MESEGVAGERPRGAASKWELDQGVGEIAWSGHEGVARVSFRIGRARGSTVWSS